MIDLSDQTRLDRLRDLINRLEHHKEAIVNSLDYAHGTHTFDDVCTMILLGKLTLWERGTAFAITEMYDTPQKRVLHVFLASGSFVDLVDLHPDIINYAKDHGASVITLAGRKGWERVFKKHAAHYNWEHSHVTLRLDLSEDGPDLFSISPDLDQSQEEANGRR